MRPIEADWIRKRLLSRDAATVSPLANIGSQTLEFRTIKKPHIEERLFKPLREAGIEVVERVPIPDALIPADARVEMDAKVAAGYFTPGAVPGAGELARRKGRGLDE